LWDISNNRVFPKDFPDNFNWEEGLSENSQSFGLLPARIPVCRHGAEIRTEGQNEVSGIR
jgi:hypothetical protein